MNATHLHLVRSSDHNRARDDEGPLAAEALAPDHGEPVMPDESLANRGIHRGDVLQVADMYAAWDYRPGDVVLATFVRPAEDPQNDGSTSFVLGVLQRDVRQGYWLQYDGPEPWGLRRIPGRPLFVLGRVTQLHSTHAAHAAHADS